MRAVSVGMTDHRTRDGDDVALLADAWEMLGRARGELSQLRAEEREAVAEVRWWALAVIELTALVPESRPRLADVSKRIATRLEEPLSPEALATLVTKLSRRRRPAARRVRVQ